MIWPWLWDWSKLDGPTISIICATFFGPIAAVQAQKWIERWNEQKRNKVAVFTALMYTRATPLSNEHVQALNRTGLAFYKVKSVMSAWQAYLDNLGTRPAKENEANHFERRADLFRTMLFEMSKHLKYPFSETDIKNTAYRPELHGAIENAQLQLLGWASDVAAGKQQVPISVVVPPEVFETQTILAKWLKDIAEGNAAIPVRTIAENLKQPKEAGKAEIS